MLHVCRHLGRADLTLARLYEGHANGAQLVEAFGSEDLKTAFAAAIRGGALSAIWNTERPGHSLALTPRTDGSAVALTGGKIFCSGARHVARPVVCGTLPGGGWQMCVVPMDATPHAVDPAGWDPLGVRGTGDVFDPVRGRGDDPRRQSVRRPRRLSAGTAADGRGRAVPRRAGRGVRAAAGTGAGGVGTRQAGRPPRPTHAGRGDDPPRRPRPVLARRPRRPLRRLGGRPGANRPARRPRAGRPDGDRGTLARHHPARLAVPGPAGDGRPRTRWNAGCGT